MNTYPQIFYPTTNFILPTLKNNPKSYSQGWTESFFEYKLEKYFKGHVLKKMIIEENTSFPYEPDYILAYPEYSVYVDIEIDEPYIYKTGNSTHHEGKDIQRNKYFLSKGWGIIRFSEEQIVKYPNICCHLISIYLGHVTGKNIWGEGFQNTIQIPLIPTWTKEEAIKMSEINYRNVYLHLLQKIEKHKPQIVVLADGIFLHNEVLETETLYCRIHPNKFFQNAKTSIFVKKTIEYLYPLKKNITAKGKIYVEFIIFISSYHSFCNFEIDEDLIYFQEYVVNIYYVRTNELIWSSIVDYVESTNQNNIMLIADDLAYSLIVSDWKLQNKELILMRKRHNTEMPNYIPYVDISYPLGIALGLEENEL
jgi:very-short-patch-repair endonuclease